VEVAEQIKLEVTLTPLLGLIDTVDKTGSVFSTDTLVLAESMSPDPSVAVALQVMLSVGEAVAKLKVKLEVVPSVVVPLVHSYDIVGVSPSASVADDVHESVELVVTPVDGVITGVDITGAVLPIAIEAEPTDPNPPSESTGVTITLQYSPFEVAVDGSVAETLALESTPPSYHSKL
jgi:hypothetical protein